MHDPETREAAAQARQLGGIRRRRSGLVRHGFELPDLATIPGIRRLIEIGVEDTLLLESGVARNRTLNALPAPCWDCASRPSSRSAWWSSSRRCGSARDPTILTGWRDRSSTAGTSTIRPMATDQRRRVRKVEAAVLGAVDVAREWFEEVRRWGSLVEYARAQALEPDAPDDATRIARRVHAGLAGHGRADVGRVVVDSLFLRELLVELDRLVLEATDRLGVRLRLLILGRAGWRPGDHGGRSWDWVAGELVGEARRIDRVIATVAQELGGTDVVLPTTAEAWKPVRDCADTVAAWLPVPSGRVRTRHARRAEYEFRALVDRCRASVLDSLGYSELARRILRYGLLGFDGSASHGHRLAGGVSADGRWLVFTAEQVRKYLPPPWGEAPAVAYADYRAAEAGDPEDDEGQDQDGMEGVDEKADG